MVIILGMYVPVYGEAQIFEFEEARYKFWTVVSQDGAELTIRETVGKVSLQERIDHFLRDELKYLYARALLTPAYVAPAHPMDIARWAKCHPQEIKTAVTPLPT